MPKFKRRRRRKKYSTKFSRKVKKIVKKEVGKTRETQKFVSYMGFENIPTLLDSDTTPGSGLIISLTGGGNPQNSQTVQQPGAYNDKILFTLLPASTTASGEAQQAGQGGMVIDPTVNASIGGVHQLEGRQCYLKTWYASIIVSNSPQQVLDPRSCFIRMFVIETRRPLARNDIAQQIFLQNQAVAAMTPAATVSPQTVTSYINRDVVKRVYMDKLIKLTGPAGTDSGASSAQMYTRRFKVRLNRKARWSYYYETSDPASAGQENLVYQGPFVYLVLCSNQPNESQQPQIALSSILTFYDD